MAKNQAGVSKEARAIVTELYKSGITDVGILANESGLTENQVQEILSKFTKKTSSRIPEGEASAPIDESQTLFDILKQAAPNNKRIGSAIEMFIRFGNLDDLGKLRYVLELSGFKPNEQKIAMLRWALHRGLPIPKDIKEEIDRFKVELPEEEKKKLENANEEDVVDKLIDEKVKRLRKMAKLHELEELEKLYANKPKEENKNEEKHKKHKMPLIGPDGEIVTTQDGRPVIVESDDILPFLYMQMMGAKHRNEEDENNEFRPREDPHITMLQSRIQRLEGEISKVTSALDSILQKLSNKNEEEKSNEMINLMNKINELEKKITEDKYKTMLESQRTEFENKVNQLNMTISNMQKSLENNTNNPVAQKLEEFKSKLEELEQENRELKHERERRALDDRFSKLENSVNYLAAIIKQGGVGAKSDIEVVAQHQKELVDSITGNLKDAANMWLSPIANAVVDNQRMQNIINLAALEQKLGYEKGTLVNLFGQTYPFINQISNKKDKQPHATKSDNLNIITPDMPVNNQEMNAHKKKLKKAFDNIISQ